MSDDTTLDTIIPLAWCSVTGWPRANRKSAITWATGYLSQPPLNPTAATPDGGKASFPSDPDHAPNTWDWAREYYHTALTYVTKEGRETAFAETFQAVGQVLHLLEDMAVPAHVRNDFQSHVNILDLGIIPSLGFSKWTSNPFEKYVRNNSQLVATIKDSIIKSSIPDFTNSYAPGYSSPRLTDFWDTEQYNGINYPNNFRSLGLAEFTNINYYSDNTILLNKPSAGHVFTFPLFDELNYTVCKDLAPNSLRTRKYISRKIKGPCPSVPGAADHFAAVSFFTDITSKPIAYKVELDDNVHKTYLGELVPLAMGYSAGLLDYFFRGQINIVQPDPNGESDKYYIKNESKNEDMVGEFSLYYDSNDNIKSRKFIKSWENLTIKADSKSDPVTFDVPTDAQEPGKYMLVFRGIMGNERDAVVGRVVRMWREEWDKEINKDLAGNHPWLKSDPDLKNHINKDGLINTKVVDSRLVMDNSTYLYPLYGEGNVNETIVAGAFYKAPVPVPYPGSLSWSFCKDTTPDPRYCLDAECTPWLCYSNDYGREFPIIINKDTWFSLKIDAMTKSVPASCPTWSEAAYQGVVLGLNIGSDKQVIRINFTFPGNETPSVNKNLIVTPGEDYSVNIYELLPLELQAKEPISVYEIKIIQQIYCGYYETSYQQHMKVDYIRVMDR